MQLCRICGDVTPQGSWKPNRLFQQEFHRIQSRIWIKRQVYILEKHHSLFDFIYFEFKLQDSCWYQTNWWKEVLWFLFSSGELWLGLEKLYKLTSEGNYSLRITLEDFDGKSYVAVFDQFKVIKMMVNHVNDGAGWARRWLRAESGRFRRTLLHPRRLVDHSQPRWDEVQCQVREF